MHRQFPLAFELLEARHLLSITFGGHTLHVTGEQSLPNTITVGLTPGGQSVVADLQFTNRQGALVDQTKTYPLSDVHLLIVTGGNKSDTITIDQTNGLFPVTDRIYLHNGNDTVTTGDEADQIFCGNGYDVVNTGNGNDTLIGGHGVDTLFSGNGNDYIRGGVRGHSDIVTGSGDNILIDPFGHDTLMAGSGADVFIVKNIHLDPVNDYDPNKDKLKHYTPPVSSNGDSVGDDILNYLLDSLI
jgi:Ca2+-binding RTX toxin-like protein